MSIIRTPCDETMGVPKLFGVYFIIFLVLVIFCQAQNDVVSRSGSSWNALASIAGIQRRWPTSLANQGNGKSTYGKSYNARGKRSVDGSLSEVTSSARLHHVIRRKRQAPSRMRQWDFHPSSLLRRRMSTTHENPGSRAAVKTITETRHVTRAPSMSHVPEMRGNRLLTDQQLLTVGDMINSKPADVKVHLPVSQAHYKAMLLQGPEPLHHGMLGDSSGTVPRTGHRPNITPTVTLATSTMTRTSRRNMAPQPQYVDQTLNHAPSQQPPVYREGPNNTRPREPVGHRPPYNARSAQLLLGNAVLDQMEKIMGKPRLEMLKKSSRSKQDRQSKNRQRTNMAPRPPQSKIGRSSVNMNEINQLIGQATLILDQFNSTLNQKRLRNKPKKMGKKSPPSPINTAGTQQIQRLPPTTNSQTPIPTTVHNQRAQIPARGKLYKNQKPNRIPPYSNSKLSLLAQISDQIKRRESTKQQTSQLNTQPKRRPVNRPRQQPPGPNVTPTRPPVQQQRMQPTRPPVQQPTRPPVQQPRMQPTRPPVNQPTRPPVQQPTRPPVQQPRMQPTRPPVNQPTRPPIQQPRTQPTRPPVQQPTRPPVQHLTRPPVQQPSMQPTRPPVQQPTRPPVQHPTRPPVQQPTRPPVQQPTRPPVQQPTRPPVQQPTRPPVQQPTRPPVQQPRMQPTRLSVQQPTRPPFQQPTRPSVQQPTRPPAQQPRMQPTRPSAQQPTRSPVQQPWMQPTRPSVRQPRMQPTRPLVQQPTRPPVQQPTRPPVQQPRMQPTRPLIQQPTRPPFQQPTRPPVQQPRMQPTRPSVQQPTRPPVQQPTRPPVQQQTRPPAQQPRMQPTRPPVQQPTRPSVQQPTRPPVQQPRMQPTRPPFQQPTRPPVQQPRMQPTRPPVQQPRMQPTRPPVQQPTRPPVQQPRMQPTRPRVQQPRMQPTRLPVLQPRMQPTIPPVQQPRMKPTRPPVQQPRMQPTRPPVQQPLLQPTRPPVQQPRMQPTRPPVQQPRMQPTRPPVQQPLLQPTRPPVQQPHIQPTRRPVQQPRMQPTRPPVQQPRMQPTRPSVQQPTGPPVQQPTRPPVQHPHMQPASPPFQQPTRPPFQEPTRPPVQQPTRPPVQQPTRPPFQQPTRPPVQQPTRPPVQQPTRPPVQQPTRPLVQHPHMQPASPPFQQPTRPPFQQPTRPPVQQPTRPPVQQPRTQRTRSPAQQPRMQPTRPPVQQPTRPSFQQPTRPPAQQPRMQPTRPQFQQPTRQPFQQPTRPPAQQPQMQPTRPPFQQPHMQPTRPPVQQPTRPPVQQPTRPPIQQPTRPPFQQPHMKPTRLPFQQPHMQPTGPPSQQPTRPPVQQPRMQPTRPPSQHPTRPPFQQPTRPPVQQPQMLPEGPPVKQRQMSHIERMLETVRTLGLAIDPPKQQVSALSKTPSPRQTPLQLQTVQQTSYLDPVPSYNVLQAQHTTPNARQVVREQAYPQGPIIAQGKPELPKLLSPPAAVLAETSIRMKQGIMVTFPTPLVDVPTKTQPTRHGATEPWPSLPPGPQRRPKQQNPGVIEPWPSLSPSPPRRPNRRTNGRKTPVPVPVYLEKLPTTLSPPAVPPTTIIIASPVRKPSNTRQVSQKPKPSPNGVHVPNRVLRRKVRPMHRRRRPKQRTGHTSKQQPNPLHLSPSTIFPMPTQPPKETVIRQTLRPNFVQEQSNALANTAVKNPLAPINVWQAATAVPADKPLSNVYKVQPMSPVSRDIHQPPTPAKRTVNGGNYVKNWFLPRPFAPDNQNTGGKQTTGNSKTTGVNSSTGNIQTAIQSTGSNQLTGTRHPVAATFQTTLAPLHPPVITRTNNGRRSGKRVRVKVSKRVKNGHRMAKRKHLAAVIQQNNRNKPAPVTQLNNSGTKAQPSVIHNNVPVKRRNMGPVSNRHLAGSGRRVTTGRRRIIKKHNSTLPPNLVPTVGLQLPIPVVTEGPPLLPKDNGSPFVDHVKQILNHIRGEHAATHAHTNQVVHSVSTTTTVSPGLHRHHVAPTPIISNFNSGHAKQPPVAGASLNVSLDTKATNVSTVNKTTNNTKTRNRTVSITKTQMEVTKPIDQVVHPVAQNRPHPPINFNVFLEWPMPTQPPVQHHHVQSPVQHRQHVQSPSQTDTLRLLEALKTLQGHMGSMSGTTKPPVNIIVQVEKAGKLACRCFPKSDGCPYDLKEEPLMDMCDVKTEIPCCDDN